MPVFVVLDVVADLLHALVDRFPLGALGTGLPELPGPGLDERPWLGVALATTTMGDAASRQMPAEVSAHEDTAAVRAQHELAGRTPRASTAASTLTIASLSRPRRSSRPVERPRRAPRRTRGPPIVLSAQPAGALRAQFELPAWRERPARARRHPRSRPPVGPRRTSAFRPEGGSARSRTSSIASGAPGGRRRPTAESPTATRHTAPRRRHAAARE